MARRRDEAGQYAALHRDAQRPRCIPGNDQPSVPHLRGPECPVMSQPNTNPIMEKLRVLSLEDDENDSERIRAELETGWKEIELMRVDTREAFVRALEEFKPDVILSDFQLPGFDSSSVLGIVRQTHPDIPVIIITGALTDSEAVKLVKMGARDYVTKGRLRYLVSAVQGALSIEQGIRARKAEEQPLRQSEADIRALIEHSPIAIIVDVGVGADEKVVMMNRKFTELFGYTLEDIPDMRHWWSLAYPNEAYRKELMADWTERVENIIRSHGNLEPMEVTVACKDGSNRHVRISFASIRSQNILAFEDLTERKQAEARIQKLTRLYATLSQTNQAIVRSTTSREELFFSICNAAVTYGNFIMAWVGLVDETTRTVKPVCHYGAENGYLTNIDISIDDVPSGRGPTGTAIRDNRVSYVNEYANDERTLPWRKAALKLGFRCAAGLPLRFADKVIGALTLYADEPGFFDADQLNLLEEMATDVSFALNNIAHEAERSAAELQLKERERQYHTLADSGQALIWTAGTDKRYDYFNKVWLEFTGRTLEQLLGNGWADAVHPDDFAQCLATYIDAFDRREPFSMLYRLRRHNGEYRWLQDDGCPRYNTAGEFIGYIGYCLDVTERMQADEELKKRNAFVETLLENAPIGFAVNAMDDGRFTYISRRFADIYGVPPGTLEAVGDFFEKVYRDPLHREQIRARVMADIASGDAARMHWEDVPLITHDGERRFVSAANIPLPEQSLMISIVWDVTDRHLMEESLRENEEIFSRFMEFSPIYVFFKDENIRALRLSKNYEKMLGRPLAELLGKKMDELFPFGLARKMVADDMKVLKEGKAITVEEEFDGRVYSTTKFPIFIEGKPRFLAGYTIDITERKHSETQQALEYLHVTETNTQLTEANRQLKLAQSQLLHSAKMASIGLLAAGVAHEINNPIGYVNSNMGTLEKYLADIFAVIDKFEAIEMLMGMLVDADDPLLEELRQFKEQINLDYIRKDIKALIAESHQGLERVKNIVLDLKNFSHIDSEDQWMWADMHHVLDTTLNVIWNELKYKCEVVKEFGVLPKIYCLPSQLEQVFMNLLENAAHAIEVRGKITIRTGQEGNRIWIEVSDTGKGIPPEYFPHLFDPFFTTKPVGKGTGLGLSVSYSIVEKHHGKIEVQSEVGKGSVFRVWLPVQQPDLKEEA